MTSPTDHGIAAAAEPRRIDQLLTRYGESHQNRPNELIHIIATPLIMLSLVGMLIAAHPFIASAFMAASMVYYARLSTVCLLAMMRWSALSVAVAFAMGTSVACLGGDLRCRMGLAIYWSEA